MAASTSESSALALAAREFHATLADMGVVGGATLRISQSLDEVVRFSASCSVQHVRVRRIGTTIKNVVAH